MEGTQQMTIDVEKANATPRKKKRLEGPDIAKGIGIIAIVFGHLAFQDPTSQRIVHNAIYQFHVPIFFLLAGCFIKPTSDTWEFIKGKAQRLWGPYIVTCIVLGLLIFGLAFFGIEPLARYNTDVWTFIQTCIYGSSSKAVPAPLLLNCPHIGAIWFLAALFIALVEVKLCLRVPKAAPFILVALAIFSQVSRNFVWLPFDIQPALVGGLYVYLGYQAKQHGLLNLRAPALVNLMLVFLWFVGCLYTLTVSIAVAYLGPYFIGFPMSLCASFLVLQLSHWIADNTKILKKVLLFFGVNSLIILCVHLLFLDTGFDRLLVWFGLGYEDNALQTVNFAIQLAVCAAAAAGVKKTRYLKKIFY